MTTPIIPWIGGKRRLAEKIITRFPLHTCYVEPFAGGAALYFMRPEPAKVEVLNDINGDLVNLYRVVRHHPEEFLRQFKWALSSRQLFEWTKATPPETLTDIHRAARFYYLQRQAFGSKVVGQTWGTATTVPPVNLMRIEEEISAASMRLAQTFIEHLPWAEVMRRYDRPHTLFYCDPPYWQTEGYGVPFGWEQYEQLAAVMRGCSGKVLLSINDHPDIRELFKPLRMDRLSINYTIGGGHKAARRGELLIYSW